MFERFTDRARRVMVEAQEEARLLDHNFVGTEHVLLGILSVPEGLGAAALQGLGVRIDEVREAIVRRVGRGQTTPPGRIRMTPRAKKVLEVSLREALRLGHNYIGTEHIAIALMSEPDGVGAQILLEKGVTADALRERVVGALTGLGVETFEAAGGGGVTTSAFVVRGFSRSREAACPACRAPMETSAAYRILDVPEENGEGTAKVLFLFCRSCGATIDTLIAPDEQ